MHPDEYRAAIVREGELMAAQPSDSLDVPVPTCPGWNLERLVGHLGRVHRWAAAYLADGTEAAAGVSSGNRPPRGADVLPWYKESLEILIDELSRTDPDTPADTFAGPGTAAFWFRRQAHETAVHRWDAENAVSPGHASGIDATLAADGIEEWLTVFVPRILSAQADGRGSGTSLRLECSEIDSARWTLTLGDDGPSVRRGRGEAQAVLRGRASDLLLAVWRRTPLDSVELTGDRACAAQILDLIQV
ncbi:maleylpyruvate isomerase family mycothiol-dependent enzyme [Hoyosella altamirensis]|uniref:Uncharacterized protein (TIGR03083 family) n=1 Tax=Hoyosella altamirensis TaxID=616997 RepID=A0A839RHV3_9ACTN|nr:maleylpyruvate isomerase family mycothiol-dependent enzyme [Hoyosella altamirensis]MBB3035784.1 uncharacterized protein (TIGR03083 family) [Hoyosella altamirensis]